MCHGHHIVAWRHPDVDLYVGLITVFLQVTQKKQSDFFYMRKSHIKTRNYSFSFYSGRFTLHFSKNNLVQGL
ncbi:hypothetical protein AAKU61_000099 [Undibacterium sp. GrIS 1.2]